MRRKRRVERVDFATESPEAVVAFMDRLAAARDGWINIVPKVGDEQVQTRLALSTLFGGGGSDLTMCTWIPGSDGQPPQETVQLGIAHTTGRRAVAQLADLALAIPEGWVVEQDHPRRGLVVRAPVGVPHDAVLSWGLSAAGLLSPERRVAVWRAEVHLPVAT